jgi:hypothetical protein
VQDKKVADFGGIEFYWFFFSFFLVCLYSYYTLNP